jgi:hypothetical protein
VDDQVSNQKYTLKCMHCQNEISLCAGLAPGVIYESIRLQAKELGVEVYCNQCKNTFLFHESDMIHGPAVTHEQCDFSETHSLHETQKLIANPVSFKKTDDSIQSNRDYLLP